MLQRQQKRANENSVFGYYFVDDKLIEAISRAAEIQNNLIAIANETGKSNIFGVSTNTESQGQYGRWV